MATLIARSGPIRPGANPVHVILAGVDTEWVQGLPGEPEFTAQGAAIEDQSVLSATSALLTLAIDADATSVVITDPSTEETATLRMSGPALGRLPYRRKR